MAKSVEEIKAEVTALVKSQGNQGAISLGTVLDDITELAGEGGGGGATLPTVYLKNPVDAGDTITVDTTEDTKAIYDTAVTDGVANFNVSLKPDEVGGDMLEMLVSMPTVARAIAIQGGVAAIFMFAVGLTSSILQTALVTLTFSPDGSVAVTNNVNQYNIPQQ